MNIIDERLLSCIKDVHICELKICPTISEDYWLTPLNIVWDIKNNLPCQIRLTNRGYPYVQLRTSIIGAHAKTILYHRLLACARIENEICECVGHLDDNPLNCVISNLLPSTQRRNVMRAFENKKHLISEAIFKVVLPDLTEYIGSIRELSEKLKIPRITLYDRYYKEPFDITKKYAKIDRISILSVEKIKDAEQFRHRSIDYRKGSGNKFVLHLDDLDILIT